MRTVFFGFEKASINGVLKQFFAHNDGQFLTMLEIWENLTWFPNLAWLLIILLRTYDEA